MTTAQNNNLRKKSISALAVFTIILGLSLNAHKVSAQSETIAQNQVSLTAIPPRMGADGTLSAAPGEKIQVQVRLRNIGEETVNVVTSTEDFIIDTDGKTPIPIDASKSNRWSLASWLTITPTEHSLAANETIGINVLIDIPEDALPGGHYAMILHEPGTKVSDDEKSLITDDSSSAVNQRVGTLIYLTVEGRINEEAYIRDFTFPTFSEYGPVPFNFTVENNSDIHIRPQMNIEISNIFGTKIDTIEIEPKNIFPLSSRGFEGKWKQVWGFGLYNAKLTMSFGTNGAVVIAKTSFWLFPIKVVLAIIVGILLLMILFFAIKRHLDHRKKEDQKKIDQLENQIQNMQNQEIREMEHDDKS